jgi:hypothetical protein
LVIETHVLKEVRQKVFKMFFLDQIPKIEKFFQRYLGSGFSQG